MQVAVSQVAVGWDTVFMRFRSVTGRNNDAGKKVRVRDGFYAFWTLLKYRFATKQKFVRYPTDIRSLVADRSHSLNKSL